MLQKLLSIFLVFLLISCKKNSASKVSEDPKTTDTLARIENKMDKKLKRKEVSTNIPRQIDIATIKDDEFVDIELLSDDFVLDVKYATKDNFLKEAVYDCGKCYLRGIVAKALLKASVAFKKKGYKIKLYDCYRPHSVQKKMWKIVPNPGYVADPKGGSVHNRGGAVDMSLTDLEGNSIAMGTDYDFFGKKAAHW